MLGVLRLKAPVLRALQSERQARRDLASQLARLRERQAQLQPEAGYTPRAAGADAGADHAAGEGSPEGPQEQASELPWRCAALELRLQQAHDKVG